MFHVIKSGNRPLAYFVDADEAARYVNQRSKEGQWFTVSQIDAVKMYDMVSDHFKEEIAAEETPA